MGTRSKIEWTNSTWPVVTGCTPISAGCDHCYAARHANRFTGTKAWPNGFDVTLWPDRLDQPLRWRAPRKVFVCSTGDLFHAEVPDDYIARVWAVMASSGAHTFQVLTKRHARMFALLNNPAFWEDVNSHWLDLAGTGPGRKQYPPDLRRRFLPNVWLGVSVESQYWADRRIPALLDTPAAIRYLSLEPLLELVKLGQALRKWTPPEDHPAWDGTRLNVREVLHWVIVGGESGPGARPMHPDWARSLRDECLNGEIAFFFKQFGEYLPVPIADDEEFAFGRAYDSPAGGRRSPAVRIPAPGSSTLRGAQMRLLEPGERTTNTVLLDRDTIAVRVGKQRAGRVLDGQTWDQYPDAVTETATRGGTSPIREPVTVQEESR
ncbi:MAG: phage Gp37/Gp68 family protein [Mycolicibacterium frederiksbergense]|nr:phage Gp37/Gp68 family protein [Mycolicibacterium frederiksbergense]